MEGFGRAGPAFDIWGCLDIWRMLGMRGRYRLLALFETYLLWGWSEGIEVMEGLGS